MKAETFLERIERKPVKKQSNNDAMVLLLYDIKLLMQQQNELLSRLAGEADSSGQPAADDKRWWERIFS